MIAEPTRTPWNSLNARLEGPAGLQLTLFTELGSPSSHANPAARGSSISVEPPRCHPRGMTTRQGATPCQLDESSSWWRGTIAGLAAAALIAAGTTALWADHSKTDKDGYFSSGRQAVSTQTHAFVSDPIEIDEGADWIFDDQGNLTFRIATAGTDGRPVFVGVAPKDAVART